jgi:HK97 family phage portal protein
MKFRTPWYRPEVKENPADKIILMGLPKTEIFTPISYKNLSEAGYRNCMTVYSCINTIIENAAALSWNAESLTGKKIENHPALALLNHPNPQQGKRKFLTYVLGYKLLSGNSYIFAAIGGGRPQFLYSLRPDRMTVLPGRGFDLIGGYRYKVQGQECNYTAQDILHIKMFNPLNDFYGMGPVEAAARGIDISNYADTWNAAIIKNDMKPPGAFSTEGSLSPQQFDRIKVQIGEEYQGYNNAGRPLLLEGGLKFTPFAMAPKDLDWLNSNKATMRKICAMFRVPSQLLGDTEASTYSNYQEARKALHIDAVLPHMEDCTDEFNNWLMPMFGNDILKIDKSKIEALQENQNEKYTYLGSCDFLTINEKREAVGKDVIGPNGDVILVPMGKIPLERQVAEPEPVPAALALAPNTMPEEGMVDGEAIDETLPDNAPAKSMKLGKGHWSDSKRREMLWKSFDFRVKAREKTFENIAKDFLKRQAQSMTDKVDGMDSLTSIKPENILDVKKETKRYEDTFTPWYTDHYLRAHEAGIQASKGDLFDDAEFKADKPTSWVASMTVEQKKKLKELIHNSGTKVNETALGKIEKILIEANEKNWTVNEFAQQLSEKVSDLTDWRAMLWARTESAKVDNFGQLEGYRDIEFVDMKGWMCSFVPDSRDAHIEADGQEQKLDDPFDVGGESLQHPGDGKPGNACNCLCSIYPVVGA